MPQLAQPFNAQSVAPATADGSAAQLPVGELPVVIRSTEIRPVKDNDRAHYLLLNLEVIDGPHKGATGAYRLNIYSESPEARNIAYRQLSSVCYATNQLQINDPDQLKDKPFIAVVKPQSDPKYTQVTGVLDIQGRDPGKVLQGQPQAPAQTAAMPPAQPPAAWNGATAPAATTAAAPGPAWGATATQQAQQPQQPQATAPAAGSWNPGAAPATTAPWGQR